MEHYEGGHPGKYDSPSIVSVTCFAIYYTLGAMKGGDIVRLRESLSSKVSCFSLLELGTFLWVLKWFFV